MAKQPDIQSIQKRSLAFDYVGLNTPIRKLADARGITYAAMYKQLKTTEMQEVIADVARQIEMRHEDVRLFMQLNGPEYVREMHTLAMGEGRDKMQALNWFLARLHPIKEEVHQVEHQLTGDVAEQFAGAMASLQGVLDQLPAKGSIHDDVHLLQGEDALPRPNSLDAEYVDNSSD